ncbi:MAG TPA: hypothetical protein DIU20_12235, partial [Cryomorphaceae bacterium]|nr:hypothetical protein [Cryomorphaceae bacterium]
LPLGFSLEEGSLKSPVRLSPNPAAGFFDLDLSGVDGERATLQVYDMRGSLMMEKTVNLSENTAHVEHGLPNGAYIVQLQTPQALFEPTRLIIQK